MISAFSLSPFGRRRNALSCGAVLPKYVDPTPAEARSLDKRKGSDALAKVDVSCNSSGHSGVDSSSLFASMDGVSMRSMTASTAATC